MGDTAFLLGRAGGQVRLPRGKRRRLSLKVAVRQQAVLLLLGISQGVAVHGFVHLRSQLPGLLHASPPSAAVAGKVDYLRGLKENVIMGRLTPAGTGLERYRSIELLNGESPSTAAAEAILPPAELRH